MVTVSIQTSCVWHHHNGNDYGSVAVTPFVYPKVNIDLAITLIRLFPH